MNAINTNRATSMMRMIMRKGILKPEALGDELLLPDDADIDGTAGV